ncbi:hypothetical protein Areg01_39340 [Actinoplanes regularis]|nr:hypothetical protein Areg01_39340 [Actinoplanes regularis]
MKVAVGVAAEIFQFPLAELRATDEQADHGIQLSTGIGQRLHLRILDIEPSLLQPPVSRPSLIEGTAQLTPKHVGNRGHLSPSCAAVPLSPDKTNSCGRTVHEKTNGQLAKSSVINQRFRRVQIHQHATVLKNCCRERLPEEVTPSESGRQLPRTFVDRGLPCGAAGRTYFHQQVRGSTIAGDPGDTHADKQGATAPTATPRFRWHGNPQRVPPGPGLESTGND